MPTIDLPWARKGGIIGIVDPPRGGLRKSHIFFSFLRVRSLELVVSGRPHKKGRVSPIAR